MNKELINHKQVTKAKIKRAESANLKGERSNKLSG